MNEKHGMPSEQTPLLVRVTVVPQRPRYPHQTLRRLCTVILATGCAILLLLFLLPSDIFNYNDNDYASYSLPWSRDFFAVFRSWPKSRGITYDDLQRTLLTTPSEKHAREWSKYYTAGPHLAGKNLSQAEWTRDKWESFGVKSEIVAYELYINYPKDHRLALLEESSNGSITVKYEAKLEEDILKEDETSGLEDRIPTFHGYSATGNVTASYVFVNYGSYWDFEDLVKANVSLAGKIALAKYGGIFRGLKVKRAQELGMVGAVIYSDPGDDGEITVENGYKAYPEGPARNPSSVQRGSVQYLSFAPGDPTTPGYPSKPGVPRVDPGHALPSIPSIPISYLDALPLLKTLNGHGPNASSLNKYWNGGGLRNSGVNYNIGPSPSNVTLNLFNEQEYVTTPIWNVIGIINGTIPDEVVVLGNHRDAWIAGGAGDPNSGSAALLEVIRSFGQALEAGWKPLRTIVFASWDGEEYGLLGSTEWVEEYLPWLSKSAVAYLNVDVGAVGTHFQAASAPLLDDALIQATKLVLAPNQTDGNNRTVRDHWDGKISTMGSGSDFTAFQDFAGIPSLDIGFKAGPDAPIYHYHSNYDSFSWMDSFGDRDWTSHTAIAKVWSLIAADFVEKPVLNFNATNYAVALARYLGTIKDKADEAGILLKSPPDFTALTTAISELHLAATAVDDKASSLREELKDIESLPWYKWWSKLRLIHAVRRVNNQYKYLERQFLYSKGLDGRSWFKHTVFAPGIWTGYAGATFPGLTESIDNGDLDALYRWQGIITEEVYKAVELLK